MKYTRETTESVINLHETKLTSIVYQRFTMTGVYMKLLTTRIRIVVPAHLVLVYKNIQIYDIKFMLYIYVSS